MVEVAVAVRIRLARACTAATGRSDSPAADTVREVHTPITPGPGRFFSLHR